MKTKQIPLCVTHTIEHICQLQIRVEELTKENTELKETVKKQSHSAQFRSVEGLQDRIASLEDENNALEKENDELKETVKKIARITEEN